MDHRNPSRSGKSEKEKQYFQQQLKKIPSGDTAPIELPFEPSDTESPNSIPRKTAKRPQSIYRKVSTHLKNNSAAYICCVVVLAFGSILTPFIGLNREVGELKTDFSNVKTIIADVNVLKEHNIGNDSQVKYVGEELRLAKDQLSLLSNRMAELFNSITAIRTYLVNKFKAKID